MYHGPITLSPAGTSTPREDRPHCFFFAGHHCMHLTNNSNSTMIVIMLFVIASQTVCHYPLPSLLHGVD